MPQNDEIQRLLSSSCKQISLFDKEIDLFFCKIVFDYFTCLKIVEILKETEKESKNMFGMYSSQRMKDWRTIVSNFEKNSVYIGWFSLKYFFVSKFELFCLVDCAQIVQRNVAFEIPALKKQINKCQQIRDESNTRHAELEKTIHEIEKQYSQLSAEMSIKVCSIFSERNQFEN